ncbi:MAG: nucleotidyltransferase family protein [Sulfitobacter sp.]
MPPHSRDTQDPDKIAILVLAAGASRRMQGRDKLMEPIDAVPLLRRQVLRALATGADVYVALPCAPHPRYDALEGLEVAKIAVADADEGMNASLRAGIAGLPQNTPAAMVLLADMPDITESDLNTVLQSVDLNSEKTIWRATTSSGDAGHPIVFRNQLFAGFMRLKGDQGGSVLVKENRATTQFIALPQNHARTDLDTPEAWANWRANRHSPT